MVWTLLLYFVVRPPYGNALSWLLFWVGLVVFAIIAALTYDLRQIWHWLRNDLAGRG